MNAGEYRILPAREEDVRWAAALGARVYGGLDVISEETMVGWFRMNPFGFFTFWCGTARVGNFDVLPLTPVAMDGFVAGALLERELGKESLVQAARASEVRDIPGVAGTALPGGADWERVCDCGVGHGCGRAAAAWIPGCCRG